MGHMGPGGIHFSTGGFGGMPRGQHFRQGGRQRQPQQQQQDRGFMQLLQLLPILVIFLMSFFGGNENPSSHTGGSNYFSLTHSPPHINPMKTRVTKVKDIPYYVSDKFLRTYA